MQLPIYDALPELLQAMRAHTRVVLEAPPGAGKTTVVPLALLDQDWLAGKAILLLEPRRIAARSAANYMAKSLGEAAGETVGYRIRFENKISKATRIEVITEGILTRLIQDDPMLEKIGCIIFDEFHERHLHSDLALALALDVQSGLRDDLRILVMSATLDGERLSDWLAAVRVRSEGRAYPVDIQYAPAPREEPIEVTLGRAIRPAIAAHPGDVLVFLPGRGEIDRCAKSLANLPTDCEVHALHGELSVDAQAQAMRPADPGLRKIVLATNVAESSVTLPGVRIVIDSGLAREPEFDPNTGFSTLQLVQISKASATQRAGRAGRVAPGLAIRLWSESKRMELQTRAEILKADLAPLALDLAAWGSSALQFLDPPPPATLNQARELLQGLGAIDSAWQITANGKRMLQTGAHPRLANLLTHAKTPSERALACDLLALMEARDPFKGSERFREDWLSRWQALDAFRQHRPHGADSRALAAIDQTAKQWRRRLQVDGHATVAHSTSIGNLLLHAFTDRVAKRRADGLTRYAMSSGRGGELSNDSPLRGEPWLIASEIDGLGADARIRRAAPFDPDLLQQHYAEWFFVGTEQKFDVEDRAVKARKVERFDALVLSEKQEAVKDAALELAHGVAQLGLAVLPWSEGLQQWRMRAMQVRAWMPELAIADLSDDALTASITQWLTPFLQGKSRLTHIQNDDLREALRALLDRSQLQAIETHAPKSITVPSGMTRDIEYQADGPPILAVKLQELFGLAQTPRIAGGRVALMLHLLSPGGKPVQVTQDLKNFWDQTYAEVKKEMKGRYPKHPWPDDPWNAPATHRAKPRGT
jgi:ATP-dependent helicase HrpB